MSNSSAIPTHSIQDGKCIRCGCSSAFIERFSPTCNDDAKPMKASTKSAEIVPRCPKCRSTSITSNKAGFGLGKAVVGGVALGPAGFLAGFFGSRKIYLSCMVCGHSWKPGTERKATVATKPKKRRKA